MGILENVPLLHAGVLPPASPETELRFLAAGMCQARLGLLGWAEGVLPHTSHKRRFDLLAVPGTGCTNPECTANVSGCGTSLRSLGGFRSHPRSFSV